MTAAGGRKRTLSPAACPLSLRAAITALPLTFLAFHIHCLNVGRSLSDAQTLLQLTTAQQYMRWTGGDRRWCAHTARTSRARTIPFSLVGGTPVSPDLANGGGANVLYSTLQQLLTPVAKPFFSILCAFPSDGSGGRRGGRGGILSQSHILSTPPYSICSSRLCRLFRVRRDDAASRGTARWRRTVLVPLL